MRWRSANLWAGKARRPRRRATSALAPRCLPQRNNRRRELKAMFTDWAPPSLHHLAIFTLASTIAAELAILMGIMDAKSIVRLTAIDAGYGAAAVAVVIFGVCRVIWGAKGYEYYLANHILDQDGAVPDR